MDGLAAQALARLAEDVRELLPAAPAALTPSVSLGSTRVGPTGIGAFVGPHRDPEGEIRGRRVQAELRIGVIGDDGPDLEERAAGVTAALLAARPGDPTQGTFLRVRQDQPEGLAPGEVADDQRGRLLRFQVIYELLQRPSADEGLIAEVATDLHLPPRGLPRRLFAQRFEGGILQRFEVFDDPGAVNQAPSDWDFDAAEGQIRQRRGIWGGSPAAGTQLAGSVLLLAPGVPRAADLLIRAQATSDERGIGLVFRWQGPDDYYFLLLDATVGFRRIGRKVAGTFGDLEQPAVDSAQGYDAGGLLELKLEVVGDRMRAFLAGEEVLAGSDRALAGPGRVGLLARRNPTARFSALEVLALDRP